MRNRRSEGNGCAGSPEEELVVLRTRGDLTKESLHGLLLVVLVVLVLLVWSGALVYLGLHFL
jgi:hypothetical protein